MGSQWRVGMAGVTGLDYAALPMVMEMAGIERGDQPDVFDGIRVMEDAALEEMNSS